jgi:hypothetical protein
MIDRCLELEARCNALEAERDALKQQVLYLTYDHSGEQWKADSTAILLKGAEREIAALKAKADALEAEVKQLK